MNLRTVMRIVTVTGTVLSVASQVYKVLSDDKNSKKKDMKGLIKDIVDNLNY